MESQLVLMVIPLVMMFSLVSCTFFSDAPIEVVQKITIPRDTYVVLDMSTRKDSMMPFVSFGPQHVERIHVVKCIDPLVCKASIEVDRSVGNDIVVIEPLSMGQTVVEAEVTHPVSERRKTVSSRVEIVNLERKRLQIGTTLNSNNHENQISEVLLFERESGDSVLCVKDRSFRRSFKKFELAKLSEFKGTILECRSADRIAGGLPVTLEMHANSVPVSVPPSSTLVCLSSFKNRVEGIVSYRSTNSISESELPQFERVSSIGKEGKGDCP